ncbi:uncharacterized protein GGS25DRAFT_416862 [Hypoxylon fragiforme]|uniref:uncharacterized protein n=1 Tax=Hypoxylon fragiforme TaxID=63214 RepID=UPI0020C607BD|nr:uncharacterized protein GGS25DRAFT_416862 [Hypoxylon fragiforme]KAI2605131.1 hypothetical protein GGS25DRAFT_416862 [Hypoxylon fragiforme]
MQFDASHRGIQGLDTFPPSHHILVYPSINPGRARSGTGQPFSHPLTLFYFLLLLQPTTNPCNNPSLLVRQPLTTTKPKRLNERVPFFFFSPTPPPPSNPSHHLLLSYLHPNVQIISFLQPPNLVIIIIPKYLLLYPFCLTYLFTYLALLLLFFFNFTDLPNTTRPLSFLFFLLLFSLVFRGDLHLQPAFRIPSCRLSYRVLHPPQNIVTLLHFSAQVASAPLPQDWTNQSSIP